ncbi:uncharacterized protein CPUR_03483 [Claviceps purpurea 20.1]|uniref:Uncharacterized protein n=1 Tax=Claviceps purpurea (strain 20.1) TaxID=1111077 RepID=M1W0L0_CLAP2|nr:uncharacterized protein CPUR_03483 [Claviceps purpurea 20.1]
MGNRPDQMWNGDLYEASTALHFAVVIRNVRLTKTLLDMKANITIPCSTLLWRTIDSEELLQKVSYFQRVFKDYFCHFGPAFPMFLAFLQNDADTCKLLVEHGAGREAMIIDSDTDSNVMSILHFAAADPTADCRQWQCLFDRFREYIDEPGPRRYKLTPLHVALMSNCIQGMQIVVETRADKEARNSASHTPLSMGIMGHPSHANADSGTFEKHTRCLRKFVDLGGSVNPEGDSSLGIAVQHYARFPVDNPLMRQVIYFLLEHHVDINRPLFD